MKTEKELMDWADDMASGERIAQSDVEILFKGMKLVPADAVVLTLEDAEVVRDAMHGQQPDHWTDEEHAAEARLAQAIEQAKEQDNG